MSFSNPINFPFPAEDGDYYEFESRVYNYQKASGLPGYWELTNPGTLGSAGGQEITDARVFGNGDNDRYIGPAGLADSAYLNQTSSAIKSRSGITSQAIVNQKGAPFVVSRTRQTTNNDDNGLLTTSTSDGIDFFMERATTSKYGSTKLSNDITSTATSRAGTSSAVNQARRRGSESAYSKDATGSGSIEGYFRIKASSQATTGFQLSYGFHAMTNDSHYGTVSLNGNLTYSSNDGGIGAIFTQPYGDGYNLITVLDRTAYSFRYKSGGGLYGFWWLAMGKGVGMSQASNPYSIYSPDGTVN